MSDPNVVFPQKILKKFILLYKDLPCLWDKQCPAYKIKMKRHDAITKLTELVQNYDPSATRVHVLRKIESLRACVRREFKRVQESRRKATCEEEVYVPHLWYYDLLAFICNDATEQTSSPVPIAETEEEEEEEQEEDDCQLYDNQSLDYANDYNDTSIKPDDTSTVSKRYLTFDLESTSKVKRQRTEVEDEYDAIGINVAAKLRYLPSNMRVLAEKLINDVLFQAQTNGLTSATMITTPDPFKSDPN